MQRKDLALRVLSTAAIMSIVTSIAAPAFAGTYYIGKGSIDVEATTDANGKQYVKVTQGKNTYEEDESNEIVIKDGTDENDTTLKEAKRAAATPAVAPAAGAATQELEAAGLEDAAGESQPDPDDAFTLNETEEDSAQTSEGNNPTEDTPDPSTEPPKKDVVYEYAPADPDPEQPTTKLAPTTSATPTAKTQEATLAAAPAAAPAATTPAAGAVGSADNPTKNVIRVINNWVGDAAKELKIRLSNVNIKVEANVDKAAMDVSGGGTTKIELDGQNALDGSVSWYQAGLRKQEEGTLIITDETDDEGKKITTPKSDTSASGSLTAKGAGSNGAAGIGGKNGESTKNIIIEGYATVDATGGGNGAGIGGGGGDGATYCVSGNAENIIIQGHSKVTAIAKNGAAIGGGSASGSGSYYSGGSAKGIVIRDHATVVAKGTGTIGVGGWGAAIGAAGYSGDNTEAVVTIGTKDATDEDVHIIATGLYGSAIGNGAKDTKVTIQGHVTIQTASTKNDTAIGSNRGNVEVTIKDNVAIDTDDAAIKVAPDDAGSGIGGGYIGSGSGRTVVVNIDGGNNGKIEIGKKSAITGQCGAISGTKVNIGNNVILKMNPRSWRDPHISVNNAEAAVGTRDNPKAGGLVNTIGDNTELWYLNEGNSLQKIIHGKNICTKKLVKETAATCTTPGSKTYECTYEHDNSAVAPEHTGQWTETIDALGHDFTVKQSETPATCERAGTIVWKCSRCDETKTETIPATGHSWGDWEVTTPATCTEKGEKTRKCRNDPNHVDRQEIPATGHQQTHIEGKKEPTCTEPGYTGDEVCDACGTVVKKGTVIPATGHHWKDNGDGTHTCPDCGATEGQPFNTNSALELRVVDAEGMDQPFTVSQNGTLRTYTGAYDTATLTGDLDTLRYLQDHGAQTIQFVTNGQTSSFAINDLLAQGSGSEVFYLTHRGAEEPTLLLVEADHSELVKD